MATPYFHKKLEHSGANHYRPDIDGLRAIAVLFVVAFHAFPSIVRGGFVGVDVFFVISGYLITKIILIEFENRRFSFVKFYSRRIKRIFPALLLVLLFCFGAGWIALLADEFKQLGKHIFGGAVFVSNFMLWNESGYFDNAADTKPLLHLWSLGIEEQFYIVWPLLLWLLFFARERICVHFKAFAKSKMQFGLLPLLLVTTSILFALSIGKVRVDTIAAFYSPLMRFWELLAGSTLAYLSIHPVKIRGRIWETLRSRVDSMISPLRRAAYGGTLPNALSFVGLVMILVCVLLVTKEKKFPGWWALLPTLGAVLIISAGARAWVNRVLLSHPILVWFGLISFPLYLWHWPLLSFARIIEGEALSIETRMIAVVLATVFAWLTFKFVEAPLRSRTHSNSLILLLCILMVIIGFNGYNAYQQEGLVSRTAAQIEVKKTGDIGQEDFYSYLTNNFYPCTPKKIHANSIVYNGVVRCFQSKQNGPNSLAVIGDSHAEHLFIGLAELAKDVGVVYFIKGNLPYAKNEEFAEIFDYVINEPTIRNVVISAFWNSRPVQLSMLEMDKTVGKLIAAKKMVYLAEDVPKFSFDPKKCKYKRRFLFDNKCDEGIDILDLQKNKYLPQLKIAKDIYPQLVVLDLSRYLCNSVVCSMAKEDVLLYRDVDHLNINGSQYMAQKIVEAHPQLINFE